jgi:hypothetical protein
VSKEAQHPLPGDESPGGPGDPAPSGLGRPVAGAAGHRGPGYPASLVAAPHTDAQDLDEVLDWEMEALPREDDPYRTYCEEGESRDEDEWPEESYLLAAPGAAGPEQFAVGGAADAMAPGPVLAILTDRVQREGLEQVDDDQLTGVLQAANRLAAWAVSQKLAATSRLAARREADGRQTGDWRPFDHVDDEVAVALTLTRRSAARLLDLALSLDRLPLTRAALAAGLIDERRAEVIAEELAGLDDEHAAAVEKLIIGKATRLTSGQLRALVRRVVLSADPQAARKRKEAALKDARVEMFPETSGTAALSGRDLPPAAALAADKHLTALAQALQAAGIPGTLDTLRARAYLHLLTGQGADTLILQTTHPGPPGRQPPRSPGAGTPGDPARTQRHGQPDHAPVRLAGLDRVPGRGSRLRPHRRRRLPHPRRPARPPPRQPVVRHPHRPRRTPCRPRLRPPRPPRPTQAASHLLRTTQSRGTSRTRPYRTRLHRTQPARKRS